MSFEQWLLAYGQIVWIAITCSVMLVAAMVARIRAARVAQRHTIALVEALETPVVAASEIAHTGKFVGIAGRLQARKRGPVAETTSSFAWDPEGTSTRLDSVHLAAGEDTIELCGPIEVCVGSRQVAARPMAGVPGLQPTLTRTMTAGDRAVVFGRLERAPGQQFVGYRQAAGTWRLRPERDGDAIGAYFTGKPRVRWWPWCWASALAAGLVTVLVLMAVGHRMVTADHHTVRCDGYRLAAPRAAALASATPVFRDWGLRRYAMYHQHECAAEQRAAPPALY